MLALAPNGIIFEEVSLARAGRPLFDRLSLVLAERRIGLIGDNGSGKSTLLRLAAGLLPPDAGRVVTAGQDTVRQRRELPAHVGFVFQNPDHQIIFPTVAEEISFGLTERGLDRNAALARTQALLTMHDCASWEGLAVGELSDGQKQLVCILAVIAPEPRLVLLDEPFASLDLPTRCALGARIRALPQTLVMASHDLDLLAGFDRVIWLEGGRVRQDGAADEVIDAYRAQVRGEPALMKAHAG